MYILLERNSRGSLEVSNKVIDKIIKSVVLNVTEGIEKLEIQSEWHYENQLFVCIKMFVSNREKLKVDEIKLNNALVFTIKNAIDVKPKNISLVYIKNH